ncbi:skp1-like protein 3 [Quercus suber]|uniref:Skp1-like protein 3 n=1 Tax=Quercus suber TaxID=58331 RepID=A0AAW0J7A8_QUESU
MQAMANQDAILNSTATSTMRITLKSADDKLFMVKEAIAMEFGVLKFFLEDSTDLESTVIPLLNVSGSVLGRVIHYCEKSLSLHLILPPSTQREEIRELRDEEVTERLLELSTRTGREGGERGCCGGGELNERNGGSGGSDGGGDELNVENEGNGGVGS